MQEPTSPAQVRQPLGRQLLAVVLALACMACAAPEIEQAQALSRAGRHEEALRVLDDAARRLGDDPALRTAHIRERERVVVLALSQAELALAAGRLDEAQRLLERALTLDAAAPRLAALSQRLAAARSAAARPPSARPALAALPPEPAPEAVLRGPAFAKPVSLEFRDAPLRQVFEALARGSGVNFVFDKDVRADARITVFLRAVTLDEAMRVILATQQLGRKLLNAQTVLIYPNTLPKQREHQELQTRTLYLANADPKHALNVLRTMTKTRDIVVDERLNALVVRDVPEVLDLTERLLATIDLPDPEVMLAVEVLEVASDRLESLGLSWPSSIGFGLPEAADQVPLSARGMRGLVTNPALAAALRSKTGSTNLLANPTIRARNREKAKVQIGEKLPVFSTTAVANAGVSASVSYLDVGLKLDVEPSVQLDGDVVIKVALEVSNLLSEVSGPSGSAALAYRVGTRLTTTSLRLHDGQTQVLAGLISDEDRRSAAGLPGLAELPLVGRLFGVRSDTRNKTEIVMLITPHVVRGLQPPEAAAATLASGTDTQPGAAPLRLQAPARAGVGPGRGASATRPATDAAEPPVPSTAGDAAGLVVSATAQARVGQTVAVTLANRSGQRCSGELSFDVTLLQPASAPPADAAPGRWPFVLEPHAEAVLILRVLPAAAGQTLAVQASADLPVTGDVQVQVPAGAGEPR